MKKKHQKLKNLVIVQFSISATVEAEMKRIRKVFIAKYGSLNVIPKQINHSTNLPS